MKYATEMFLLSSWYSAEGKVRSLVIFDTSTRSRKERSSCKIEARILFTASTACLALVCLIFFSGDMFLLQKDIYPLFDAYFKRDVINYADYLFVMTSFTHICKWLDVQVFSDKDYKP